MNGQARHALRRAWRVPARSAIAIVACMLAWLALFDAAAQRQSLESMQAQAGRLGGHQAYRISIEKAWQPDGRKHVSLFPREFVELALLNSAASILKIRGSFAIRGPRDARTTLVDALFYRIEKRDSERAASFPSCSLLRADDEASRPGGLLHLPPNWRCLLAPFPAGLHLLDHEGARGTLALPLAALPDIAGSGALGKIETVWLSFSDPDALRILSEQARTKYRIDLKVQPVGLQVQGQAARLMSVSRLSGWFAAASLLAGIGLYVHGVYGAVRRETSLRACIGMPAPALARWLATDVLAQAILLATVSGLAAALVQFIRGHQPGALQLAMCVGAVELLIAVGFALACGAAARVVALHPRVGQLVR